MDAKHGVLTAPHDVRRVLAQRPDALTAQNRLFVEEIARWQKAKVPFRRQSGSTATEKGRSPRGWTVGLQRISPSAGGVESWPRGGRRRFELQAGEARPRQKWSPRANARWLFALGRPMSKRSGWSKDGRVPVHGDVEERHPGPRRQRRPADRHLSLVKRTPVEVGVS